MTMHVPMTALRHTAVLAFLLLSVAGCDSTYRYFLFSPVQPKYTLVPDYEMMRKNPNPAYSVSKDSQSVIFDRKTFKVEVKFMSDDQLNNVEFPEESKDGENSSNPFTYGNWVDPKIGYTPTRFSVFKISIYNYTAPKLNFDPENSMIVSDRGDLYAGYGREEKTSRNQSLETYFKKRKGASGVDDDIMERRMGLVRTTVLYLGRPIYAGDNREGLVVYDPLVETILQVKLILKDFIVGYDQNNEPNDFTSMQFFFKRVEQKEIPKPVIVAETTATTAAKEYRTLSIHQLRYRTMEEVEGGVQDSWNVARNALPGLSRFLRDSLRIKAEVKVAPPDSPELKDSPIIFLFVGPSEPLFAETDVTNLAAFLSQGGFLFVDNAGFSAKYQYAGTMESFLTNIAGKVDKQMQILPIPQDHEIYRAWRKLASLPEGTDDREKLPSRTTELKGLFWKNRIVAILSTKAYSLVWDQQDPRNFTQNALVGNIVEYVLAGRKK